MRVKLIWIEIPAQELPRIEHIDSGMALLESLGSSPRKEGEVVEGMTVPQGKVWLFPMGSFELGCKLARLIDAYQIKGDVKTAIVTI